jgi:hypothetical protein
MTNDFTKHGFVKVMSVIDTVFNESTILFKDGFEIWPLTSALHANTSLQYKQRQYDHEYGKDGNDLRLDSVFEFYSE